MTKISLLPELATDTPNDAVLPASASATTYGLKIEKVMQAAAANNANHLHNGSFYAWQRGGIASAATVTDAAFNGPDRWYSLRQGSGPTIQRVSGTDGSNYAAKMVAGGATNRFGLAQALPYERTYGLRDQEVTFQARVRSTLNAGSGNTDIRAAILSWTGTADSVAGEVVNDWTDSSYTTGNFFTSTTLSVVDVSAAVQAAHNTWTDISVSGVVDNTANNSIVMIWTEDAPANSADYLEICKAGLYLGGERKHYVESDPAAELLACQRFHYTSVCWETTTPANPVVGNYNYKASSGISTTTRDCELRLPTSMHTTPSITYWQGNGSTSSVWAFRDTGSAAWEDASSMSATIKQNVAMVRLNGISNSGIDNGTVSGEISLDSEILV